MNYILKIKKNINSEEILKLTNLVENHSFYELVNNCLALNDKKTINILNENNYSGEDAMIIIRTFLNKAKQLNILAKEFENSKNIESTISKAKPPIFWKDKEITKLQIKYWTQIKIKKLLDKINETELLIKKNLSVRQAESFVKIFKKKKGSIKTRDVNVQSLENEIIEKIGLKVLINNKKDNKGSIKIEYKNLDQLNRIIKVIKSHY